MAPGERVLRDTDASVCDYDPEAGAVFVATDTGARYVGDGDRWRPLADPDGGAPVARGGTHRAGAVNYEAGYTKPVFHWSFDGGARNNYRYRDVFDELGLSPTLAISPARLADDGKLSWDELAELQTDHGWGVSNHGHRHDRFDELTPAEQEAEVVEAVDAFRAHGIDHRHYMYSWGMAGGATGRSVVANYYPFAWGTVHAPDTAGIVDVQSPYALPRTFVENASEAELAAAVDRAIERGTGMVLFGHNVVDGESVDPDGFETDVGTIEWLTRYVREQGGEWVDDLDTVVRYAKTPVRVAAGSEPVRIDDVAAETVRTDDLSAGALTTETLATDDLTADGLTVGRLTRADIGATVSQSTEQSLPTGERTHLRLDEAGFDPEKISIVGLTGPTNPRFELEWARERGISLFTLDEVLRRGPVPVAEDAVAAATAGGSDGLYLTLDVDVLDASAAPGTGVPTNGGLQARELLQILGVVASAGLDAMDVVEVSPGLDPAGVTARMAVRAVVDCLAASAVGEAHAPGMGTAATAACGGTR